MEKHILYMQRCLQLAAFARGNTSPNPMVGAVLVCDGKIVAEGYHHRAGEPHAEPMALNQIDDVELLRNATLYVSLEPCSHYGKTPPCAELIIKKGIRHVVVAMLDPNPQVAGRGIRMMQEAGIEVEVGVMEKEAMELNKRFICFFTQHRPYVIMKWAQTADGYLDYCRCERGNGPVRISNEVTKTLNHQIRTQEDAILVGTSTAMLDDPHLTSRKWGAKNPLRCVIDLNGRLCNDLKIWNSEARTICFTTKDACSNRIERENVEYVELERALPIAAQILKALYERGIQSVIVEGGAVTLNTFIQENLWDEARIETSNEKIQSGVEAPKLAATPRHVQCFYDNKMHIFLNRH